jgi:hypothetical protein
MAARALLMALMDPGMAMEDEFNDWYDLEHLPQMRAVPGIDTAVRFVAVQGWPRYLAVYDRADFGVLRSVAYRSLTGSGFTPWSRRILTRVKGWQRLTFIQEPPGDRVLAESCHALQAFVFKGKPNLRMAEQAVSREVGVIQARSFGPGEETHDGGVVLVEAGASLAMPQPPQALLSITGLVFSATYVRYDRTDPVARFHALEERD